MNLSDIHAGDILEYTTYSPASGQHEPRDFHVYGKGQTSVFGWAIQGDGFRVEFSINPNALRPKAKRYLVEVRTPKPGEKFIGGLGLAELVYTAISGILYGTEVVIVEEL